MSTVISSTDCVLTKLKAFCTIILNRSDNHMCAKEDMDRAKEILFNTDSQTDDFKCIWQARPSGADRPDYGIIEFGVCIHMKAAIPFYYPTHYEYFNRASIIIVDQAFRKYLSEQPGLTDNFNYVVKDYTINNYDKVSIKQFHRKYFIQEPEGYNGLLNLFTNIMLLMQTLLTFKDETSTYAKTVSMLKKSMDSIDSCLDSAKTIIPKEEYENLNSIKESAYKDISEGIEPLNGYKEPIYDKLVSASSSFLSLSLAIKDIISKS